MTAAIWIIIAVITGVAGYVLATVMSRTSARSRANTIVEDARKEADVLKEEDYRGKGAGGEDYLRC